jgi:hypothetical protein
MLKHSNFQFDFNFAALDNARLDHKVVSYNVSTHTCCAAELDSVSGAKKCIQYPYRDVGLMEKR